MGERWKESKHESFILRCVLVSELRVQIHGNEGFYGRKVCVLDRINK